MLSYAPSSDGGKSLLSSVIIPKNHLDFVTVWSKNSLHILYQEESLHLRHQKEVNFRRLSVLATRLPISNNDKSVNAIDSYFICFDDTNRQMVEDLEELVSLLVVEVEASAAFLFSRFDNKRFRQQIASSSYFVR